MRRTPLRPGKGLERGTPLARTAGPTRRTRLTAKGGSRFPKRRDPDYCQWVRSLSCEMGRRLHWWTGIPCSGPVECAHVKSRGAGGDDRGNCLALCRSHHRLQHRLGWPQVARDFAFDPAAIAKQLEAKYVLLDFGGLSGSAGERTQNP